jgi:ribosomal protein L35AE/L33A
MNAAETARQQELERTIAEAREALRSLEEARDGKEAAALLGKCYVFRNCYSCPDGPQDYWGLYLRVVGVEHGQCVLVTFERDKNGDLRVERSRRSPRMLGGGYREISLGELRKAWRKVEGEFVAFGALATMKAV